MANNRGANLSKSQFIRGTQCPKQLWLEFNKPEERVAMTDTNRMEAGTRVGELARSYFGEYSLVPYSRDKSVMIAETERLIESGVGIIAEASFASEDGFCSVDILTNHGGGHVDIIEVKSSTGMESEDCDAPGKAIPDEYYDDIAFQYHVLTACGYTVKTAQLMRLNKEYVRHGELDIKSLFVLDDITDTIRLMQGGIASRIEEVRSVALAADEPSGYLGSRCSADCGYYEYCWRDMPQDSVYKIGYRMRGTKKDDMYYGGVTTMKDALESGLVTNENQLRQIRTAVLDLPPHIDKAEIAGFLGTLTYPLYHLDFETFDAVIPEWDGVHPYMKIPFQYSLHVQDSPCAEPRHYEFLGEAGTNPLRPIAESLCANIPPDVCVLAYNRSFEMSVIKELASVFPDLADHLMSIHGNIEDLIVPFRKGYYYRKEMGGSNSIKSVLPAMFPNDPELDYHALDLIHHGGEAMAAFPAMAQMSKEEQAPLRKALLAYCKLDTLAMVRVLGQLYSLLRSNK